jgi:hypothetical protein
MWDVEVPTFSRQPVHSWWWDCQPHAPAALYPQEDSSSSVLLGVESTPGPSLSWNKAPIWGLQDFYYCQTVSALLMCGALSDERTGLSFTIAAGPRQCSHSRVQVPLHSWPNFTVSDSRFPFSSPPTTRRATVEVFDPASTRYLNSRMQFRL